MNSKMHFDHLFEFKIDYKDAKQHLTSTGPVVGIAATSAAIAAIPASIVVSVAKSV